MGLVDRVLCVRVLTPPHRETYVSCEAEGGGWAERKRGDVGTDWPGYEYDTSLDQVPCDMFWKYPHP